MKLLVRKLLNGFFRIAMSEQGENTLAFFVQFRAFCFDLHPFAERGVARDHGMGPAFDFNHA